MEAVHIAGLLKALGSPHTAPDEIKALLTSKAMLAKEATPNGPVDRLSILGQEVRAWASRTGAHLMTMDSLPMWLQKAVTFTETDLALLAAFASGQTIFNPHPGETP